MSLSFFQPSDHNPLTHALSASPDRYSPRKTRHLDYISQFTSDIRHLPGTENIVADALSQIDINALYSSTSVHFALIANQEDPELPKLQSSSLQLKEFPLPFSSGTILCDTTSSHPRPYIPLPYRRIVFDNLHSSAHPGIRATQHLIAERYVWTRSCVPCQQSKVTHHTKTPLSTFATPDAGFAHVHIDIVGHLPLS